MIDIDQTPPIDAAPLTTHHILLVDDEANVRDVLKNYLTKQKYEVSTAATGADAHHILQSAAVDLIIVDYVLPDSDGLDLVKEFRRLHKCQRVIVASGTIDEDLERRALASGAAAFVSKTAPLDELIACIERTLARTPPKKAATPDVTRRRNGSSRSPMPRLNQLKRESMATQQPEVSEAAVSNNEHSATTKAPTTAEPLATLLRRGKKAPSPPVAASTPTVQLPKCEIRAEPEAVAAFTAMTPEGIQMAPRVAVFLTMLASYDPNLGNTAMRAVVLSKTVAAVLALSNAECQQLLWAAALHDIGLVKLDRNLVRHWLRNPNTVSKPELKSIHQHPAGATEILKDFPVLHGAREIILAHHEHWDGSGFPDRLQMETIPWLARLLPPVISYCSQHSPNERLLAQIQSQANVQFDKRAIEALVKAVSQTSLPVGSRELTTMELIADTVLAGEIADVDGHVIAGKGIVLTHAIINRLFHLAEAGHIDNRVLVAC